MADSELLGLGDEADSGLLVEAEESEDFEESDEACEGDAAEDLEGVDSVGVGLEAVGETVAREPAVAMVFVDDVSFTEAQAAVEAMARAAAPAATAVQRRLPGASRLLREGLRDGVREGLAECWPKGNHES